MEETEMFFIGQRVQDRTNRQGTVVAIPDSGSYIVDYDAPFAGHTCDGWVPSGRAWEHPHRELHAVSEGHTQPQFKEGDPVQVVYLNANANRYASHYGTIASMRTASNNYSDWHAEVRLDSGQMVTVRRGWIVHAALLTNEAGETLDWAASAIERAGTTHSFGIVDGHPVTFNMSRESAIEAELATWKSNIMTSMRNAVASKEAAVAEQVNELRRLPLMPDFTLANMKKHRIITCKENESNLMLVDGYTYAPAIIHQSTLDLPTPPEILEKITTPVAVGIYSKRDGDANRATNIVLFKSKDLTQFMHYHTMGTRSECHGSFRISRADLKDYATVVGAADSYIAMHNVINMDSLGSDSCNGVRIRGALSIDVIPLSDKPKGVGSYCTHGTSKTVGRVIYSDVFAIRMLIPVEADENFGVFGHVRDCYDYANTFTDVTDAYLAEHTDAQSKMMAATASPVWSTASG